MCLQCECNFHKGYLKFHMTMFENVISLYRLAHMRDVIIMNNLEDWNLDRHMQL